MRRSSLNIGKSSVWKGGEKDGSDPKGSAPLQKHGDTGCARDAGSRAQVFVGAAKVQYSDGNRASEREERDQDAQRIVRAGAERTRE
jgi:hypothetical protein